MLLKNKLRKCIFSIPGDGTAREGRVHGFSAVLVCLLGECRSLLTDRGCPECVMLEGWTAAVENHISPNHVDGSVAAHDFLWNATVRVAQAFSAGL